MSIKVITCPTVPRTIQARRVRGATERAGFRAHHSCGLRRLFAVRRLAVLAALVLVALPGSAWGAPVTPTAALQPAQSSEIQPAYVNTCAGVTAFLVNGSRADTYHLVKVGAGPFEVIPGSQVTLAPFQTAPPVKAAGIVGQYLSVAWQPTSKTDLDLEKLFTWARPDYCNFNANYIQTCAGITTTITNAGQAPAEYGLLWVRRGIDGVSGVPGVGKVGLNPGQSRTVNVSREGGLGFSINWQPAEELDVWDNFTAWVKPANCDGIPPTRPQLESEFVDGCFGVDTNVTNVGTAMDVVSLLRRQEGIDPVEGVPGQRHIVLEPGQSYEARVHAVDGRGFSLRWQSDSVLDIGDEFHTWVRPAGCAGDNLPVTGTRVGYLISAGVLVAILGLLLTYAARRRPAPNRA